MVFFKENFEDLVIYHIEHDYLKESTLKSEVIPLGLLKKNEAKTEDMVDIMSHYQKYCPVVEGKLQSILLGGDGLTCERAHDAWLARSDGVTQEDRLDGLVIKSEDWHKNAIICRQLRKIALQRSDVLRAFYRAEISLYDPEMMVFVDESGFDERISRRYGYSFKGTRATITRYFARTPRLSVVAAIGLDGLRCLHTFQGTVNGDKFLMFLQQDLIPNSVVVMDNAAIHHVGPVQQAILQTGAKLIFLPPYSPDLNPIEEAFSKVKGWIRSNGDVWAALTNRNDKVHMVYDAFYQLSADDCFGYFNDSEYV
ncbi:hypothetical protein QZH41_019095 [Actinostola sp. cb2023]|nr:hypothetical protein QZH41_019095 [Actinostola sp. cb2023]